MKSKNIREFKVSLNKFKVNTKNLIKSNSKNKKTFQDEFKIIPKNS